MVQDGLFICAGFILLFAGAEGLVRGSVRLSLRWGISPLVIGLTVVAFGTSAPELFVSIKANIAGSGDIAVGNIVGSNIFNLAFILGIAALLQPIRVQSQLISQDIPVMMASSCLFAVLIWDSELTRLEGVMLLGLLIAYVALTIRLARQGKDPALAEEIAHHLPTAKGPVFIDLLWMAGGIGLLVSGSSLLVTGAVSVATAAGVSEAVIGLTLIAAGTGLPELATTVVAAAKKETDLAVGNVVGSNIFNVLCIGGAAAVVKPIRAQDIEGIDLGAMIAVSLLVLPLCWSGLRVRRREGLLLLACYGAYLYAIWPKPH